MIKWIIKWYRHRKYIRTRDELLDRYSDVWEELAKND